MLLCNTNIPRLMPQMAKLPTGGNFNRVMKNKVYTLEKFMSTFEKIIFTHEK